MTRFSFEHKPSFVSSARFLHRVGTTLYLDNTRESAAFAIATGLEDEYTRVEPKTSGESVKIIYRREIDAQDAEKAVQDLLINFARFDNQI